MTENDSNERLFAASGRVLIKDSLLTSFLYELMSDHLTPGKVEELVNASTVPHVEYTNGWLALYAQYLACRLNGEETKKAAASVLNHEINLLRDKIEDLQKQLVDIQNECSHTTEHEMKVASCAGFRRISYVCKACGKELSVHWPDDENLGEDES